MAIIFGTPGNDPNLNGTSEADNIFGLAGADILLGDASNDHLFGDSGNDQLFGGSGNDRLNGGIGNDLLNGGTGIDVADYSSGFVDPPGLIGPQPVTGATAGVTVNLNVLEAQNTGGDGNDLLMGPAYGNATLNGDAGDDELYGNGTLNGGAGNDTLESVFVGNNDAGEGTFNGGAGNDTLRAQDDYYTLNGGAGADTLEHTGGVSSVAMS